MAEYDQIGSAYEQVKEVSLVKYVELPNVLRALENVAGQRVLDLACGTGYYTRIIRQRGATKVVGVDISEGMIKRAREIETHTPLGITYQVMDASELPVLGSFDLVNAIYFLNYAPNEAVLYKMAQSIFRNLTPGGTLFTWTINPDFSCEGRTTAKYGAILHLAREFEEGREVSCEILTSPPVVFTNYILTRAGYERALLGAGFREISWIPASVPAEILAQFPAGYWEDLFANPIFIGLQAR